MTIEISVDQILFFIALVVSGWAYGFYTYRRGLIRGWDNAMFSLADEGIVKVDEETLEVSRVSDREYKSVKSFYE